MGVYPVCGNVVDTGGRLWVYDSEARRVLRWAMVVYGLLPVPVLAWMAWQLWPHGVDPQGQRLLYLVGAFALL